MTTARISRAWRTILLTITLKRRMGFSPCGHSLHWYVMAIMLSVTILSSVHAKYSGGTGEPDDPYQIATAEDLMLLGENPEDYDKNFILTADIDLDPNLPGGRVFDRAVIARVRVNRMRPIGPPFSGVLDGNGHLVSHLTIIGWDFVGLLGQLASEAEVRDLGVVDVNVSSRYYGSTDSVNYPPPVGGLVGDNLGTVSRCYSTGVVTGTVVGQVIGGLIGGNSGTVTECYSTCLVSGNHIGGLAGSNWGLLSNCAAFGSVSGGGEVGGLVGGWNVGWILASCSYGDVVGNESVGGLVGENIGYISHAYARGSVTGNEDVGGLVGNNTYYPIVSGEIETSYSTGLVSGSRNVGGLVHRGHTKATTADDCFWDIQTSGQTTSDGGIGKTTNEMQTAATFLDAGWDFVDETANGTEDIWWILEGKDYPKLWWEAAGP